MTYRVDVKPELLRWARERADTRVESLIGKFPKYRQWESGEIKPTYKQLENFAKAVHVGIGYFFSSEPPEETFPFAEIRNKALQRPSPDLIDTIYLCQLRQDWYREFVRLKEEDPSPFIGSAKLDDDAAIVAELILHDLDLEKYQDFTNWNGLLQLLIERADMIGVLVMVSGVAINNTHRSLNPEEFRGFALADPFAPLIFINGADTKEAQLFTLAHELAHLWLDKTGFSNNRLETSSQQLIEDQCDEIASEMLVPLTAMLKEFQKDGERLKTAADVEQLFRVTPRIAQYWVDCVDRYLWQKGRQPFGQEIKQLYNKQMNNKVSYYSILTSRLGDRFARAVVADTLEGRTLFRDALHLLGISKIKTFHKLADHLGISPISSDVPNTRRFIGNS